ncbi:hypothetical protein LTR37_010228 [Vermiconidia calcicola]|uniref:Uncharacterized protein n=1 Tax=Vermiconidia calcicola TaxID=1690605 RepID=A0ACC3N5L7_9PEZI|nr:hypothetical protein LTR37_010228 [Vermiconidia calcicola]
MPEDEANNSLSLIKEEIAIMKKLNHHNLVSLIEVLDDPQEDSLYMVLEMCKKGVAMHVGLDDRADPYDDETCRCWFRDMILGIEYLHAQGIIHRDIKPDNCLITNDDVLKIVDFGVSEMFEKQSDMATAKSAGSPAFMPPELCVAKHGRVNGRAADIWSMGVTLYCLRYGHIPFERGSIIELYGSIRGDDVPLQEESNPGFADLMKRILEKDPEKRTTMDELRNHPWVTKNGADPLLSAEENCADLISPPTAAELDHAITGNMSHLLVVMKAVKRFKKIVNDKHGRVMEGILGRDSQMVAPPDSMRGQSAASHDRHPMDKALVTDGVHRSIDVDDNLEKLPQKMDGLAVEQTPEVEIGNTLERNLGETEAHFKQRLETLKHRPTGNQNADEHQTLHDRRTQSLPLEKHAKGHAHDPLEDTLFLDIGYTSDLPEGYGGSDYPVVSESPSAVDINIYELAYQAELEKILARRPTEPSIYMNRRVDYREDIRSLSSIKDAGKYAARSAAAKLRGWSSRGYAAGQGVGDAGRSAGRDATDKFNERWASGSAYASPWFEAGKQAARSGGGVASDYLEPWKQAAKPWTQAAKSRIDNSRTAAKLGDLYNKSASGSGGGLSKYVSRAQAKYRGDAPGTDPKAAEQAGTAEQTTQPPSEDVHSKDESATQSQRQPPPPPIVTEDVDGNKDHITSTTGERPQQLAFKGRMT